MNWESIIFAIVAVAIIPLVKWGLDILKDYVEAKVATLEDQKIANIISDAYNTVQKVVLFVMQTYVDSLKAKGEFDPMAQEEAFKMAQKRASELINDTARQVINEKYGNFATWLDTQIENSVRVSKN